MDKLHEKRLKRSFEKTLLDSPVPNRKLIKLLPEPLKPTKYVAPAPKPKLRTQKSRVPPPVPLPRSIPLPKPFDEKVNKLINEITPFYKKEAIKSFEKFWETVNH